MEHLSKELYVILLARITKAITKAKYEPETVAGYSGPADVASEVLRPYIVVDKRIRIAVDV